MCARSFYHFTQYWDGVSLAIGIGMGMEKLKKAKPNKMNMDNVLEKPTFSVNHHTQFHNKIAKARNTKH